MAESEAEAFEVRALVEAEEMVKYKVDKSVFANSDTISVSLDALWMKPSM